MRPNGMTKSARLKTANQDGWKIQLTVIRKVNVSIISVQQSINQSFDAFLPVQKCTVKISVYPRIFCGEFSTF